MIQTSKAKHSQSRATHYAATKQAWRESGPYLELDDCTITVDEVPSPCPPSKRTVDSVGILEFEGVTVVIPVPFISPSFNRRVIAFWKSHGFEVRNPDNTPHPCVESYVWEMIRPCDVPLRERRFSARAWIEWVTKKKKELYS